MTQVASQAIQKVGDGTLEQMSFQMTTGDGMVQTD